jgi:hypothetical protein
LLEIEKHETKKSQKLTYSPVAQSVEQLAVNQLVGGSSPSRGARFQKGHFSHQEVAFLFW